MIQPGQSPNTPPHFTYDKLLPQLLEPQAQPEALGLRGSERLIESMSLLGGVALEHEDPDEYDRWSAQIDQFTASAKEVFPGSNYTGALLMRDAYGVAFGHEPAVERYKEQLAGASSRTVPVTLRTLVATLAEEGKPAETWINSVLQDTTQRATMNNIYYNRVWLSHHLSGKPFHPQHNAPVGMIEAAHAAANNDLTETCILNMGANLLSVAPPVLRHDIIDNLIVASEEQASLGSAPHAYHGMSEAALVALTDSTLSKEDRQYVINELYIRYDDAFDNDEATTLPPIISDLPKAADIEAVIDLELERLRLDDPDSDGTQFRIIWRHACRAAIYHNQPEIAQALLAKSQFGDTAVWSQLVSSYVDWVGKIEDVQPDVFTSLVLPERAACFGVMQALSNRDVASLPNTVSEFMARATPADSQFILSSLRHAMQLNPATGIQLTQEIMQHISTWESAHYLQDSLHILQTIQGVPGAKEDYLQYLHSQSQSQTLAEQLLSIAKYRLATRQKL